MKDPRDVIIRPVVSEKSYAGSSIGVYTFEVHPSASKPEIRDAVQRIFNVKVLKVTFVQTCILVARLNLLNLDLKKGQ